MVGLSISNVISISGKRSSLPKPTYFGIVVDTTQSGVSNNDQFQFTGALGDYDVTALQNDTEVATFNDLSDAATITLPSAGVYQLRVQPKKVNGFNRIAFNNGGDKDKLTEIKSWGSDVVWSDFGSSFYGCSNLGECNIVDVPNLTNVTNMFTMFLDASNFNSDLSGWDVSNVTNMSGMLRGLPNFTSDLSGWDVSNVTNMSFMFFNASNFNSDLSNWNVSNVISMSFMFFNASNFNSDLSNWDVSSVVNTSSMFRGASKFNSDLSQWDVSNVTILERMFEDATNFNSDLSQWDVSNGVNFRRMFINATSFKSDLSQWDVSNGTNFSEMFLGVDINEAGTTTNYDNLLNGWSALTVNSDLSFNGGNSQYSAVGATGRDILINTYNWTISDAGLI